MSTVPDLRLHAPEQLNGSSSNGDAPKPLHRVRAVRMQQGMSRRAAARRLGVEPKQLDAIEDPANDLTLTAVYKWQKMLQVPLEDLLVESDAPLSRPVMERAQMLKLMKTAVTIRNRAKNRSIRHLAEMLVEQIVAIMPDLADIGPWSAPPERPVGFNGDGELDRELAEREFLDRTLKQ